MTRPSAVPFVWLLLRPSAAIVACFAGVLVYATYLAWVYPPQFDEALEWVLLGQFVVASTGYRDRLVRGHFDGLLAGRSRRYGVALTHAAISTLPGIVLWILIGAADAWLNARPSIAFTPGGLIAVVYASIGAWTLSLTLGRHWGGVIWLLGIFALALAGRVHVLAEAYGTSGASLVITARAAGAALVWPFVLLSNGGHGETPVFILIALGGLAVLALGVLTIERLDAPLKPPE